MKQVYKSFKYKLKPTPQQKVLLEKHFGCNRLIYNHMLNLKIKTDPENKTRFNSYSFIKQITKLKQQDSFSFLKEVLNSSLQQTILDLDKAFKNYARIQKSLKYKTPENEKEGFPNFKSKKSRSSYRIQPVNKTDIQINESIIKIPKFREGLKYYHNRPIEGTIRFATVSRDTIGQYWISITTETIVEPLQKTLKEVGIDLGISKFLTMSDGTTVDNPKFLESKLPKLRYIQRLNSKTKSSRSLKKLQKLHLKVSNLRLDFLHKVSTEIVRNYDYIAIEDLAVSDLLTKSNSTLSRRISDVGWSKFVFMLTYKSEWYDKELKTIGRYEASSKTCHCCGYKKSDLKLSERIFECPSCNTVIDRDLNASINILSFSKK